MAAISAPKKHGPPLHTRDGPAPEADAQLIVSEVVGFFGVDCLPSSFALSPGQAQTEAAARENTRTRTLAMPFMRDLHRVVAEASI
jgi:hypothetical protein